MHIIYKWHNNWLGIKTAENTKCFDFGVKYVKILKYTFLKTHDLLCTMCVFKNVFTKITPIEENEFKLFKVIHIASV